MSSILKALKRLERDKARYQDDNVDLARDILRGDGRRFGPPRWLLPLLAFLALLLVLTLTVLLWPRHDVAVSAAAPPVPVATVVALAADEPVVVEEIVDRRRPALAPVRTAQVSAPQVSAPQVSAPQVSAPQVSAPQVSAPQTPSESTPEVQPTAVPAPVSVPPSAEPASVPPTAETALAVSAIVYNDDPSARLAVINDLPVMEGTMIGEVRVEEIRSDRVIFSRAGVRFAIPFDTAIP